MITHEEKQRAIEKYMALFAEESRHSSRVRSKFSTEPAVESLLDEISEIQRDASHKVWDVEKRLTKAYKKQHPVGTTLIKLEMGWYRTEDEHGYGCVGYTEYKITSYDNDHVGLRKPGDAKAKMHPIVDVVREFAPIPHDF